MNQNMYKRLGLLGWLWLLLSAGVYAQIGSWRSHVSYRSAQSVALAGQYVYAATANGLFAYDKTTGETITLTRQDGLSDVGVSRLLYLPDQSRLLIAHRTGTIDLLSLTATGEPGSIQTISTIATANNLPDARGINFINRVDNLAYLSTDFGLVVLNLTANDIRDTYFSRRSNGSPLPIYQTTVIGDSLYALTAPVSATATSPQSIRSVRLASGTNLADPVNWRVISNPPGSPRTLVTRQGRVSATVSGQGVYDRSGGGWILTQSASATLVRQFATNRSADAETVVVIGQTVTAATIGTVSSLLLADPRDVVVDGANLWIADGQSGLLLVSGGTVRTIAPAGPDRDTFSTLYAYTDRLVALPNGPQDATVLSANLSAANQLAVSANQWQSLSAQGVGQGFSAAAYLPATQTLYLGGFGIGLWQQTADQPTLVNIPLPVAIGEYITSLAADALGNLWIATGGSLARTATLHVRRPDGTFTSFPTVTEQSIQQLVPDDGGYIWIRLSVGSGLLVFDPQTNRLRPLTTGINGGGLLTNSVRALAKDRLGAIWVGTDLGPTVFDNLSDPFVGAINARPPYSNRIRLLINELITAIVVDGGNRKWLSTRTGVYRVSPDGSQLLETLTDDTSPLPLRSISALAVEPLSGRLFIQTTNGLVSHQTTATDPAGALSSPTIFPNPVRPDFTGSVGITGLTDNATVKILDAGGQLVYETRSQGGAAAWNLLDYRGRPVQTGVYLVVVVTAMGTEGVAGKLAVVR